MQLDELSRLDERLTGAVQRLALGPLDYAIYPGAVLFGWEGIFVVTGAFFAYVGVQSGYCMLLTLAAGQVANRFLKVFLQRTRPTAPEGVLRRVKVKVPGPDDPDGASFPSGDTMAASAVAGALVGAGCSPLWLVLGPFVGFARVYFWCHYVLDTVAGWIVGTSVAALLVWVVNRLGPAGLSWWHVAAAVPPFVVVMKGLKKLQARKAATLTGQKAH